jgi:hypothetical protein
VLGVGVTDGPGPRVGGALAEALPDERHLI